MVVSSLDNQERHFQPWGESTTNLDKVVCTFAFGWTLGFAFFVARYAMQYVLMTKSHIFQQNRRIAKMNSYVFMLWGAFIAIIVFALGSWLRVIGAITPSFPILLSFLAFWLVQLHFLIQIIINRIHVLLPARKTRLLLKYGVMAIVWVIIASGLPFWIPSSERDTDDLIYIKATRNRIEKISYSIIGAALNFYFVYLVHKKLKTFGFRNYEALLRFNLRIVAISIFLDISLTGLMWIPVDFYYFQFLPIFNLSKLNIEISLGELIVALSTEPIHGRYLFENHNSRNDGLVELKSNEDFSNADTGVTHSELES